MSNINELIKQASEDPSIFLTSYIHDSGDLDMTGVELNSLNLLKILEREIKEELSALAEEYEDDKEVQYVVNACDIEGWYYALVHKFNVGNYTGYNSTLYSQQLHLKAVHKTLQIWATRNLEYIKD